MFSANCGRLQKMRFLRVRVNYFKIIICVSANHALRNKPPICRDERPLAEKVNAAFSIMESYSK